MMRGRPFEDLVDGHHRLLGEDVADDAAGDAQAAGDVGGGFLQVERRQLRPQRDALLQLAQRLLVEAIGELGLADQDQVEQLDRRRLDVGEEPHFLEQLVGEALRLVDDQRRQAAGLVALVHVALELGEEAGFGLRAALVEVEAAGDELVELRAGQRRVGQQDVAVLRPALLVQGGAQDGGLAGAGVAEQHRQAARRRQAVAQRAERLAVAGRQEQEARVRREIERAFAKSVERLVHMRGPTDGTL